MDSLPQKPIKLAVLQRVCAPYRLPFFKKLSQTEGLQIKFFIGDDLPNSKVRNHPQIEGINYKKLETTFVGRGRRMFPWHKSLISELKAFSPDVILCEAESHFLGYLKAIYYKCFCDRRVGLIYWCFIGLPGVDEGKISIATIIKSITRRFFDAFLLYSNYSKKRLLNLGFDERKIFVATNVGNVEQYILDDKSLTLSKKQAREKLGLPEKFTVLYVGTLDANKHPEVLIELARQKDGNFVLLGAGPMLDVLRNECETNNIRGAFLPGRVSDSLPLYYRAADVLLIPGRGGIVISEAMTFGVPVIVHQADGTEYDLVINKKTGIHLSEGSLESFSSAIDYLMNNPPESEKMSIESRKLVKEKYNTENMVKQIVAVAQYASSVRRKNV